MPISSTEKKTKLEPSEIFCAVGLTMTEREMKDVCADSASVLSWLNEGKKVANSSKVEYGSSAAVYRGMFDLPRGMKDKDVTDLIKNVVAGFSAAIGVKKFIKDMDGYNDSIAEKVFMTGSTWPPTVQKFRLQNESDNFDYNSSDLVIQVKDDVFYGISLKKKSNAKGADPTLINKAFDTFLNGSAFNKTKQELVDVRARYFAELMRRAQKQGIIYVDGLETMTYEQIWNATVQVNNKTRALINLKGNNNTIQPIELSDIKGKLKGTGTESLDVETPDGLRSFMNKELSDPDCELFKDFNTVLSKNVNIFAEGLIDIVLKTKMQTRLRAKEIGDYHFEFALVTGYADYSKRSGPRLVAAAVVPQHSILCGLSDLAGNNKPYVMEIDRQKKLNAKAAKCFYKLKKDGVTILNLELRYKGDFKSQPQFFAFLSDEFKQQMYQKCVIDR